MHLNKIIKCVIMFIGDFMEKKKFKIVNYIWIIPLILGITLGIVGITKIISAKEMYIPPMGSENWFEEQTAQSDAITVGAAITFFGFGFLGVFVTMLCAILPNIIRVVKEKKQNLNILENVITENVNKSKKNNYKHCKYCGSIVKDGETKCSSCGGKIFE